MQILNSPSVRITRNIDILRLPRGGARRNTDRVCTFWIRHSAGLKETLIGCAFFGLRRECGDGWWGRRCLFIGNKVRECAIWTITKSCVTQKRDRVCHFGFATRRGKTETMIGCANIEDQMARNIDILHWPRGVARANTDRVCKFWIRQSIK